MQVKTFVYFAICYKGEVPYPPPQDPGMGHRALAHPLCHSPAQPSSVWASFSDCLSSWSQDGYSSSSHCISTQLHSKAQKGPLLPRAFLSGLTSPQQTLIDRIVSCTEVLVAPRGQSFGEAIALVLPSPWDQGRVPRVHEAPAPATEAMTHPVHFGTPTEAVKSHM